MLLKIQTVWFFVKIISIPDALMRNYFPIRPLGASFQTLLNLYYVTVGFVPHLFEAVYCFICGQRRVALAQYRMICLFLLLTAQLTKLTLPKISGITSLATANRTQFRNPHEFNLLNPWIQNLVQVNWTGNPPRKNTKPC